jgi:hypothetical protein
MQGCRVLGQSQPLRRERDSLRPLNAGKKAVTSNKYPASELRTSVFSQDFGRKKLTYAPVASPPNVPVPGITCLRCLVL